MFYIYKNFELQGVVTIYDSVKWTRKYNDVGTFEMEMPFTKEMFQLLEIDNVVYQKENNEACFILEKSVRADAFGNEKLVVFGKNISCILESRIASYTGTATIKSIIDNLVNSNFINATNSKRNISNFRNQSTGLKVNPSINIKYENTDVLTIIKEICQIHQIGFKVDYVVSTKQFVFDTYEGAVKTDVMFSSTFNNVIEQEYFYSLKDNKNTCLMDNNGAVTIVNDNNVGLARKETYATLSTDSTATATGQGELFLQQYKIKESMDTVIDTNSIQFFYLYDWNLGDVVTTINKGLDVTIQKNIMGIEEFFDVTGRNLVVTFGDIETVVTSNGGGSTGSQGVSGTDGYTPVKDVDYFDGKDGKDGYTPIKGIDYFDGKDGKDGVDGYTPIKGIDYFDGKDGKDGYTPIKGIDYFDGKDGKDGVDGYTPIKGIDYFDGKDGTNGINGKDGANGIQGANGADGVNGKDGLTTAVKLGTTQYNQSNGIIALPLYPTTLPANGGNSTTVNEHTVNSDVPLNAKFTDTVYTHPTTHPPSVITQDATHRFATDTEKNLWNTVSNKVDKVTGKQLSTEDFSTVEKTKLSGIATGANNYIHPAGTNPHGTTKADIGLESAENTTDIDKPISTATQNALNGKVGNERVLTNVPSGAKFTDTVYSHPTTHSADMITDGTTNKAYTAAEKTKLSGIATKANNYSHPTSDGSKHVPANGTANNGKVLKAGATAGTYVWSNDNDTITTINGKTGVIAKADITALGIPAQDTIYTHPTTHPPSIIVQDINNRFVSDSEKGVWSGKQDALGFTPVNTTDSRLSNARTPVTHTHTKSQITDMPTKLSQLIDDIGASGGEQGALIFDALAAQQGAKLKEYKVGENYVSEIRLSSNNLLLASKTESRSGTSYITVIKVYADNGTTVKQTITITEKNTSNGYETIVT